MARRTPAEDPKPLPPPATTLEGREEQLINAAMDLAERRIAEGTASAQEVVHFLRQGTVRSQLELKELVHKNEVLQTRVKEMESRTSSEDLYKQALAAMRGYQGLDVVEGDEEEYYG